MTIKEKGYAHWSGELEERKFPWLPITRFGVRLAFKSKYFKLFFLGALVPAIIFLAGIYVSERLEDFKFMFRESVPFLQINPGYFKIFLTNGFILFLIVLVLVFAGAGLICDDLKNKSLQLYFSRPLSKKDYFLGKTAVIFFFLFLITLIPALVLFIMKLVFSGSFKFFLAYPWLPVSIIGYSFLLTAFFSFYTLLLSALSKNRTFVAILIFGLYIFSDIFFGILYGNYRSPYFSLFSLRANMQQVGAFMFGQKAQYDVPWFYSFLILCAICGLSAFILKKKVKGVTIVK
jgi:ABC-type transport system involved in multi-copper enzyme maturation permease subunit